MKHLWFGAGLLAALFAVCILLSGPLENAHHTPARDLEKAADAAVKEDWDLAAALYTRARKHWESHRDLTAALARHDPIDQIDGGFAMLDRYASCKDEAAFAATCSQLAVQLRALPQSHSFRWWNLL